MGAVKPGRPGAPRWWDAPLHTLDAGQWEALCDGCGKCCLHKLEDEDTGRVYPTNVACRLIDPLTAQCSDYSNRRRHVPDCLTLSRSKIEDMFWLPASCAYKLRAAGDPLPGWHYLESGDRNAVHAAGQSIIGWTVSETIAGPLENHLVDREI